MRVLVLAAALLAGGFGLAACSLESIGAQADIAGRGLTATEEIEAPGYQRLLLPRGWQRDESQEPAPDRVYMGGPDEAWLHLSLGRYAHAMGSSAAAVATLYARMPGAPPWRAQMGYDGLGRPGPVLQPVAGPAGVQTFYVAGESPNSDLLTVVVNDPAKGLRILIELSPQAYSREEAAQLGASILGAAVVNQAALEAAQT
jgi:hypothetical protein